jgi:hypothetical protein
MYVRYRHYRINIGYPWVFYFLIKGNRYICIYDIYLFFICTKIIGMTFDYNDNEIQTVYLVQNPASLHIPLKETKTAP